MKPIKYFPFAKLLEAANLGPTWDYNRQLDPEKLAQANLPADGKFPVVQTLLHHHRHGQPAETHIRAVVLVDPENPSGDGHYAIVDLPLDYFAALPSWKRKRKTHRRLIRA